MSKFIKVTGKLISYSQPEPLIINIEQITHVSRTGPGYSFCMSCSNNPIYLDAVNAQKVFAQMGLSL